MKKIILILLIVTTTSCIPTRIAPRFEGHKIMQARKFKRKLPRETSFIFKDLKNEGEIYNYFNTKFQLNDVNVGYNTPFKIDNNKYYITYRETQIEDKKLNLLGFLTDVTLDKNGIDPIFDSNGYVYRKGHWYILISVYDEDLKNCLIDNHPKRSIILEYLKNMKKEYLSTQNYEELLFAKKS
jgi:flagellar basal body-associated protein FliL